MVLIYKALTVSLLFASSVESFIPQKNDNKGFAGRTAIARTASRRATCLAADRRAFLAAGAASAAGFVLLPSPQTAHAVGPVKIALEPTKYSAQPCPPSKPIPGEKAMKGMRGLCVTVQANLEDLAPKDLEKVGVYGFVTDGETGDSVLANNPDLSTDAGQFAMVERVTPKDKTVTFEFIAAIPQERDLSQYDNGIGPLNFEGIRIISYPGGSQFGAISPCEMNEFSEECEAWEAENGPFVRGEFMMKKNPRTRE